MYRIRLAPGDREGTAQLARCVVTDVADLGAAVSPAKSGDVS